MNKPILIHAAMEVECNYLISKLENKKETEELGFHFYEGILNNKQVVILLSGVGIINTASAITVAIQKYHPDIILNLGTAGSYNQNIHKKDIIIATSCININSYITTKKNQGEGSNPLEWKYQTFISGEVDRLLIEESDSNLVELTKKVKTTHNVYYGRIASGDAWNLEYDRINHLHKKYKIELEDMESISIYTIAHKLNIKVLSLKIISDNALISEGYDRNVGIYLQEYLLKYLTLL